MSKGASVQKDTAPESEEVLNKDSSFRILLVKRNNRSFTGADKYLSKRNHLVVSATDIKTAVIKALDLKAQFIFLAFDHGNPRIQNLPKAFTNFLPHAICIPFLETMSAYHIQKLKNEGYQYTLTPPITGPKIERMILTILSDREKENQNGSSERTNKIEESGKSSSPFLLNIKGNIPNDIHFANMMAGEAFSSIQSFEGTQYLPEAGTYISDEELDGIIQNISLDELKKMTPQQERMAYENDQHYRARLIQQVQNSNRQSRETHLSASFFDDVYAHALELGIEKSNSPHTKSPSIKNNTKDSDTNDSVDISDLETALLEMTNSCPEHLRPSSQEDSRSLNRRLMNLLLSHLSKSQIQVNNPKESGLTRIGGAIEQSSVETLRFLNEKNPPTSIETIFGQTKKALCFLIDSSAYKGYLLVATAKDHFDKNLKSLIIDKLNEYLSSTDIDIKISDEMEINIQEVEFQDWALAEAEFLHKSISAGQEIAFAFFPVAQHINSLQEDAIPNGYMDMLGVDIKELVTEIPVEFDVFMHLPINEKFIKYTHSGYRFYPNQKNRLMNYGIRQMYFNQVDLPELKRYRAQNYLNDLIQSFNENRNKPKGQSDEST